MTDSKKPRFREPEPGAETQWVVAMLLSHGSDEAVKAELLQRLNAWARQTMDQNPDWPCARGFNRPPEPIKISHY